MRSPICLILLCSLFVMAGCVSMIPVRLSPALHPRLGLIVAYPDEISLSTVSGQFGLPKGGKLPAPGLGKTLSKTLAEKLRRGGYQVDVLPITADQFWTAFAEAAKTKEGSDWHLGASKNAQVTITNLQQAGLILQNVDAVIVVGPMEIYMDSRFLSRNGTGVELSYNQKTPGDVGVLIGARGTAVNARTLELTGGGGAYEWQGLIPLPSGKAPTTLSDTEMSDLIRQIGEKSERVFEKFVASLR